ncbi:MAG: GIY-YIG nuclease family protein [Geminicoccaceae bacterium]
MNHVPRVVHVPRPGEYNTITDKEAWIYFIQAECGGPIKIGWTQDIDRRVKDMQAVNPFTLIVIGKFRGMLADERRLHDKFALSRLHGEWFEPTDELLAEISEPQQ